MDNYKLLIENFKNSGLITDNDYYAMCRYGQKVNFSGAFGALGAIGSLAAQSNKEDYLLVANKNEINIYFIDIKTGIYLNKKITFKKEDINKVGIKKYAFGSAGITIKSKPLKYKENFITSDNFRSFEQKENKSALIQFLKEFYSKKANKKQLQK